MDMRRGPLAPALLLVLTSACGSGEPGSGAGVQVVTTVSPITNIVQNIGGDRVSVTGIVPEGVNSHTFEPAPSDAAVMEDADIVFINGCTWKSRRASSQRRTSATASPSCRSRTARSRRTSSSSTSRSHDRRLPEPHLWTNPLYAKDFAGSSVMSSRARSRGFVHLRRELRGVRGPGRRLGCRRPLGHRDGGGRGPQAPHVSRLVPVLRPRVRVGGRGAIQPSDFAEPTPQEIVGLIEQIRAESLPAIFGSEVFPSPVLEQIAAETGATYVDDLRDDDLPGRPAIRTTATSD